MFSLFSPLHQVEVEEKDVVGTGGSGESGRGAGDELGGHGTRPGAESKASAEGDTLLRFFDTPGLLVVEAEAAAAEQGPMQAGSDASTSAGVAGGEGRVAGGGDPLSVVGAGLAGRRWCVVTPVEGSAAAAERARARGGGSSTVVGQSRSGLSLGAYK